MVRGNDERNRDEGDPDPQPEGARPRRLIFKGAAVAAIGALVPLADAGAKRDKGKDGGTGKGAGNGNGRGGDRNRPAPVAPPDADVQAAGEPPHPEPDGGVRPANYYYPTGTTVYDYHYGRTWFVYYYPHRVFVGFYNGFYWYNGYLRRRHKRRYIYVQVLYASPYYGGIYIY